MVKQVGIPTFFMTLSCTDLKWDGLISIIGKLKDEKLTTERKAVWIILNVVII